MNSLYERLQLLSAEQRAVLAEQLQPQTAAPANTRLVAFIVPVANSSLDTEQTRNALSEHLPDYMLPGFVQMLDALPLTPGGKVDRKLLAAMELTVTRTESGYAEPSSEIEQLLARIWSEVLALDMLSVHDNFFEIGGDSILSIQIVARARQAGLDITPALLFKHPTIAEVSAVIERSQPQQPDAQQGLVTGAVPLTPIQRWFFDNRLQRPSHWNQALLLRVDAPVMAADLNEVVRALLQQHDALRTRFTPQSGTWVQDLVDMPAELPLESLDLRGKSAAEQTALIEQVANRQHQALRLEQADLFRVTKFRLSDTEDVLLLILHHLVTDGISWRVLLEDFHTALEQRWQGKPIALPPKSTAFQVWSQRLQTYPTLPNAQAALEYWQAARFQQPQPIPHDFDSDHSRNTSASSLTVIQQLSEAQTHALLEDVPGVYHTQINDVLLTGLAQTLSEWLGDSSVLFALEGHGRETLFEGIDITRTVGWFTSVFPVRLELTSGDIGQNLLSVKEHLRAVPENGVSHGLLRYTAAHADVFAAHAEPEILFNYLGRGDTLLSGLNRFALASDSVGVARYPEDPRHYAIEVNCIIHNGCFESRWSYSYNLHSESTIQRLANRFHQALAAIIDHCLSPQAGGHSLSDFPLADLNSDSFDQIAGLLDALDN